jgi:histidinol-phosphate/aromatic aminotransferase/cobyric acid decarboxylase-like protein
LGHGVLVRDFSRAHGLEHCVRITIGTRRDHETLLDAISRR